MRRTRIANACESVVSLLIVLSHRFVQTDRTRQKTQRPRGSTAKRHVPRTMFEVRHHVDWLFVRRRSCGRQIILLMFNNIRRVEQRSASYIARPVIREESQFAIGETYCTNVVGHDRFQPSSAKRLAASPNTSVSAICRRSVPSSERLQSVTSI